MKRKLLSKQEQQEIIDAIKIAEKQTSGEIRVHIQEKCSDDPYRDATQIFKKLKMDATEQRNGVLFFVAYKSRKFTVLGDTGINQAVPDDFWKETIAVMTPLFQQGDFAKALVAGILKAGDALKQYFPYQKNDVNELDDGVSYA